MPRLKTLNRRRRRKANGPTLKPSDFARFTLCNRFAASSEGRMMIVGPPPDGGRYALRFPDAFYSIKDRILNRYGRPAGLALQHWTSYAYDYGDYDGGMKDGCHHYHVLGRTRLRGRTFHKPTGHFSWSNDVSEDYKETVGFDVMKARCVERIEGKKRVTRALPNRREAFHALKALWRRYRFLPEPPREPKPLVRVSNYGSERFSRWYEQRRAMVIACAGCGGEFNGLQVERIEGRDYCNACRSVMLKGREEEFEEIPF